LFLFLSAQRRKCERQGAGMPILLAMRRQSSIMGA
jgi:hypothetical protein